MNANAGEVSLPAHEELIDEARKLLDRNRTGSFTKPSLGQYPHQWNWDSAFIAIGVDHFDGRRARDEVRALLAAQWVDGMVPHIVYSEVPSDYFPTPDFWGTQGLPAAPRQITSGLTQPPVLATAVRLICQRATFGSDEAKEFAREIFPRLLRWHRWLHRVRDPSGSGLVAIIHPWESGTDNSTRFTEALLNLGEVKAPAYSRGDQKHVVEGERPVHADYDRFMYLIGFYRDLAWEGRAIYDNAPFLVQDVLFNSVLYAAERDLRWLAQELGEAVDEIDGWLAATEQAFGERFWNDEAGVYFDFDLRSGSQLEESTCASFMPLYAGLASERQAERMVREQLLEPRHYAPGEGSRYYLPSVSKSSPYFEPRRYWRGPIWLNVNWLVMRGLEKYGYGEEAQAIREHSIELASRSGFAEYYDPRDGSACGALGFSWSAALTVDILMST